MNVKDGERKTGSERLEFILIRRRSYVTKSSVERSSAYMFRCHSLQLASGPDHAHCSPQIQGQEVVNSLSNFVRDSCNVGQAPPLKMQPAAVQY